MSLPKRGPNSEFSLSVVVPMLNEQEACGTFFEAILPILRTLTDDYEIVCVDDGSTDRTAEAIMQWHMYDSRVKLVRLSRNFGKDIALTAGLDYATGDAVIPMDVDLQDPPELVPALVEQWRRGYDTVVAVRTKRESDTFFKRVTAGWFYRLFRRMSDVPVVENAGDFRLLDRRVVDVLRKLPERSRFMKGLYAWAGFTQAIVPYERPSRAHGTTKWRLWRLWNFALDGIFSFSTLPLRMWTYLGGTVALLAVAYGTFIVVRTLIYGVDVPGYASLLVTILFLSGINMVGIGMLGEYLGRVFIEVKQRPLYVVDVVRGFEDQAAAHDLVHVQKARAASGRAYG